MKLPAFKTKIVCTIGPASRSPAVLEELIKNGMNVARLNLSHGDFAEHAENIRNINAAAKQLGRTISIIIDLPGAKLRIGRLPNGVVLKKGQNVIFSARQNTGNSAVIPVDYKYLAQSVYAGGIIYLSDGFIQLKVEKIQGPDVHCRVLMGGPLSSHKGINLPGAKLFVDPVTSKDFRIIDFGLKHGVTTFGLSFIENAGHIRKVRDFASRRGRTVYLIAKIERRGAIENFDEIVQASDGIMIARGDMGVEIPIEEVPMVQKKLINKANLLGRPVITATQMLVSMTQNVRPTRAEANDVANAIIDGTDALMLSEETAVGKYPVEAVKIMAKIAAVTESQCTNVEIAAQERQYIQSAASNSQQPVPDTISLNAVRAAEELGAKYILTPTTSGNTARRVSRFKPPCWVLSFSEQKETCRFLIFSYGVYPFWVASKTGRQPQAMFKTIRHSRLVKKGDTVIITERRLSRCPGETDSLGIVILE